jgi:lipid A disaccharide synthetase
MAKAILHWLNQPSQVAQLVDRFEDLHQQLTMPTRTLLAQAILNTMLHK